MNTGRIRDQWHTMTRTGRSARLSAHIAEPYLEVHPTDAARLGLAPATLAQVQARLGAGDDADPARAILRVLVTDRVAQGQVFAPIHWSDRVAGAGRIGAVVRATVDPVSGQPALKEADVTVTPFAALWYGFAVSDAPFAPDCDYWAVAPTPTGMRAELAHASPVDDWEGFARRLFNLPDASLSMVSDVARGHVRLALSQGDRGGERVRAALYCAPHPVAVARAAMVDLMGDAAPHILTGQPAADRPDPGATVCACFGVGVNTILTAIRDRCLTTTAGIGAALQAGTNCGSCRPELQALLNRQAADAAQAQAS